MLTLSNFTMQLWKSCLFNIFQACLVVSTRLDGDIVEFAYTTEYSKLNRGNLNSQFLSSDALTV